MTSNDAGRTVIDNDGTRGTLQGVAEIQGEGVFATVLVNNKRVVYEVEKIRFSDPVVVQFERTPDEGLL